MPDLNSRGKCLHHFSQQQETGEAKLTVHHELDEQLRKGFWCNCLSVVPNVYVLFCVTRSETRAYIYGRLMTYFILMVRLPQKTHTNAQSTCVSNGMAGNATNVQLVSSHLVASNYFGLIYALSDACKRVCLGANLKCAKNTKDAAGMHVFHYQFCVPFSLSLNCLLGISFVSDFVTFAVSSCLTFR